MDNSSFNYKTTMIDFTQNLGVPDTKMNKGKLKR
jgi:hypothetical protein